MATRAEFEAGSPAAQEMVLSGDKHNKCRVTIPIAIRDFLDWNSGDTLLVSIGADRNSVVLTKR